MKSKAKSKSMLALPTSKTESKKELQDYSILLYGAKKIGKTSLCSQFDQAIFLPTEPGTKALEVYSVPLIRRWKDFTGYLELLEGGEHSFRTVVVDIVDRLYYLCLRDVCRQVGVEHPHDANDYGKTWELVANTFDSVMMRFLNLPMGVVMISHATLAEVKRLDGTSYNQVVPTLKGRASEIVNGLFDIIAYYGYFGEERQLIIRGDAFVEAGCRAKQFTTPKGRLIKSIPMGISEEEAYANLLNAWEGRQRTVGEGVKVSQSLEAKTTRTKGI